MSESDLLRPLAAPVFLVVDSGHIAQVGERQMKLIKICLAVAALSLCITPAAYARLVQVVSYQELFEKSDLVVIATPLTKTADTDERTYFQNTSVAAIGVETIFGVSVVIKGDRATKEFTLHHYRVAPTPSAPDGLLLGGPGVVSFDPTDPQRRRNILLFLVKEPDGRYAPNGGQTDPDLQAITALETPL